MEFYQEDKNYSDSHKQNDSCDDDNGSVRLVTSRLADSGQAGMQYIVNHDTTALQPRGVVVAIVVVIAIVHARRVSGLETFVICHYWSLESDLLQTTMESNETCLYYFSNPQSSRSIIARLTHGARYIDKFRKIRR